MQQKQRGALGRQGCAALCCAVLRCAAPCCAALRLLPAKNPSSSTRIIERMRPAVSVWLSSVDAQSVVLRRSRPRACSCSARCGSSPVRTIREPQKTPTRREPARWPQRSRVEGSTAACRCTCAQPQRCWRHATGACAMQAAAAGRRTDAQAQRVDRPTQHAGRGLPLQHVLQAAGCARGRQRKHDEAYHKGAVLLVARIPGGVHQRGQPPQLHHGCVGGGGGRVRVVGGVAAGGPACMGRRAVSPTLATRIASSEALRAFGISRICTAEWNRQPSHARWSAVSLGRPVVPAARRACCCGWMTGPIAAMTSRSTMADHWPPHRRGPIHQFGEWTPLSRLVHAVLRHTGAATLVHCRLQPCEVCRVRSLRGGTCHQKKTGTARKHRAARCAALCASRERAVSL
jgi:hypothetical protein